MRFVDIDEIYRRIDEESDRLCLLHRNHPERKWYPGLRRALRMVDGFIREQEEEDAETKKGREVFLWQLLRDQDERQLAEISRAIARKVERLSGGTDGVPDHPDAATGPSGGPADDGEASHSQVWTGLERPIAGIGLDAASDGYIVIAFQDERGDIVYHQVNQVVLDNDKVTYGFVGGEPLGAGISDSEDLRAWADKLRDQAAETAKLTAVPFSFIEERGVRVEEEVAEGVPDFGCPSPITVERWLPNTDTVVAYPGESPVGTHPGGDAGGVDRIPPNDGASDGGRPGGLRGGASGVREEGLGHSIPIQGPSGGIAQYPAQSLVPGSIARGTGEA